MQVRHIQVPRTKRHPASMATLSRSCGARTIR
jgi:hypothetical protein